LFVDKAEDGAERGPNYAPTDGSHAAQAGHLASLKKLDRYPGHTFTSPIDLAKLTKDRLSGALTKLAAYRGTSSDVVWQTT